MKKVRTEKALTVGEVFEIAKKHPLPKPKESIEKSLREIDKELWEKEL